MKKLLILLLIPMFLLGIPTIQSFKNYTGAIEIMDESFYTSDTFYVYLPLCDTVLDSIKLYFGEYDTIIKYKYPWPSVFDQHSYEEYEGDTASTMVTYDRWAMEDWAFAFFIEDLSVAEEPDTINIDVQYTHVPAVAWTVPYNLTTGQDASAYLLTFYPFDLYDNWKLYRHSRLAVQIISDSVRVRGWLVHRQMYFHENVRPGP